ncbi:MAG: hypothetical protein IJW00_09400 [Clostridia bacterium]|nr:hypothetical protein [Clostridia bacterium]
MKSMSGLDIFEKMTNVNDRFIEEAAEMPNPEQAVVKTSRWERFSHFMNSGWGVAMICCLVAAAVMTGIIAVGRAGGPYVPPISTGKQTDGISDHNTSESATIETTETTPVDTLTLNAFSFEYELSDNEILITEEIVVVATIINNGEAFTYFGKQTDFSAHGEFIYSGDASIVIPCIRGRNATSERTFTVETGQRGSNRYTATFPIDVPGGKYHLRLYYQDTECIYENVLTVIKNDTATEGTLTSVTLDGVTISITFQRTETESQVKVDKYLGSDGVIYTFYSGTDILQSFSNGNLSGGTPSKTEKVSMADARAIADRILLEHGQIPNLAAYEVEEKSLTTGNYSFNYYHLIGSTKSLYRLSIIINQNGDVFSFKSQDWAENTPYINEADIEAAKIRLKEAHPEGYFEPHLEVINGVLYVGFEHIISIDPPNVETNEAGDIIINGGCGFDHEHVFYKEEVVHIENP